ncbi:glycosyl hydrolase family 28-related protein [Pantoea anthophila]|uniref:right-handed parallel beta-helix repeat-containing protein n=1 Tax=Pantoea anthophila TaxID=470931 RepID=UPI003CEDF688
MSKLRVNTLSTTDDSFEIDLPEIATRIIKYPFANAVEIEQASIYSGRYSVKGWGAKGDAVSDDTQAIRNAINSLLGTDATLFFPAGRYVVSSLISFDLGQKSHLRIQGDGINQTEILATGSAQSVFRVTGPTKNIWLNSVLPNGSIDFSDITFGCYGNSTLTGTCLDIQLGSVVGGPTKTINIENVNFRAEIGSWATSINLYNSAQISITNCKFYAANNSRSGIGINVKCAEGSDGTNLTMTQCEFFFFKYGIYHGDHFEGIVCANCSFINCDYGIASICVAESGSLLTNCEFDCYVEGVHFEGLYDFVINGCGFLAMGPNTKAIVVVGGNGFNISGNKITGDNKDDGIGIYLEGTNGSLGRTGYIGQNSISNYNIGMQIYNCNNVSFGDFGWWNCNTDTLRTGTNVNIQDVGYSYSKTLSASLAASTTSWSLSVDISDKRLTRTPVFANLVSTTADSMSVRYNYSASSKTTAVFVITLPSGASIPSATYGFSLSVHSPFFQ